MKAVLNQEFIYGGNRCTIIAVRENGDVLVQANEGGSPFRISKRTLDGLPEPDDGEGRLRNPIYSSHEWMDMKEYRNQLKRQRILLEALQAAKAALQDNLQYMISTNCLLSSESQIKAINWALDAIARAQTPHDDEVRQ